MSRICRSCGDEFDPDTVFDGTHRHRDFGFVDQCGHCGQEDDDPGDRLMALEEGDGRKGSCQVTPVHPETLGSRAFGMGRYVTFQQHYQPIGCKK